MWGHLHPHLPLRGGPRAADQGSAVLAVESLGHALSEADRRQEGAHRGRSQDCRHPALHLDRRYRVLVDSREDSLTRNPPHQLRSGGGAVLAGTAGAHDRAEAVDRLGQVPGQIASHLAASHPLTPIMGRAQPTPERTMTPAKASPFHTKLDPGTPIREQPGPIAVIRPRGLTLTKSATQPDASAAGRATGGWLRHSLGIMQPLVHSVHS